MRILSTGVWLLLSAVVGGSEFDLYYLGGQSNMDGYGQNHELPASVNQVVPNAFIFHGNTAEDTQPVDGRGIWAPLKPGHGVGFRSDGVENSYSSRFGVELTFARSLLTARPDRKIAFIKYSRGGTSIDEDAAGRFGCWEPDFQQGEGQGRGINQYDHFLATVRNAMRATDIDGDGQVDRLHPRGIVWMQGESDAAHTAQIANQYEQNLKRLMDLIRAAFRVDDLPVVIGRISDSGNQNQQLVWKHGAQVRDAQTRFVANDSAAALVTTTDNYGYSDPWHYDSAGYVDLGKQFAKALLSVAD